MAAEGSQRSAGRAKPGAATAPPGAVGAPSDLKVLGWREWVGLPGFDIARIKAKLDTGARSSALHAFRLETYTDDGTECVRFWLHPLQRDEETVVCCEAPIHDQRWVSDSGGHRELRYVVQTPIDLEGQRHDVEMTLTNRDTMRFRMLLGRTALEGRFLVDSGRSFLLGRRRRRKR